MNRAEEYSIKYADEQLAIIDKELSETGYSRHTKMGVRIFNGSDIEQAAMEGYEQAEKDTIERACKWLFSHLPILVDYYNEDIHENADRGEFIKLFRTQMEDEKESNQ